MLNSYTSITIYGYIEIYKLIFNAQNKTGIFYDFINRYIS